MDVFQVCIVFGQFVLSLTIAALGSTSPSYVCTPRHTKLLLYHFRVRNHTSDLKRAI